MIWSIRSFNTTSFAEEKVTDPGALVQSCRNRLSSGIYPMKRHFPLVSLFALVRTYRIWKGIGKCSLHRLQIPRHLFPGWNLIPISYFVCNGRHFSPRYCGKRRKNTKKSFNDAKSESIWFTRWEIHWKF